MIKAKDIKPIPNYIIKKIKQLDEKERFYTDTSTRYYSYLTKINKDLAQVIVACKIKDHQWFCKQVVIHAVNSNVCLVRDMEYSYLDTLLAGIIKDLPIQENDMTIINGMKQKINITMLSALL